MKKVLNTDLVATFNILHNGEFSKKIDGHNGNKITLHKFNPMILIPFISDQVKV